MASRVPAVTMWFWFVKTLITSADIAWPDALYRRLGLVVASGLIVMTLAATVAAQFYLRRYRAWVFWPAMVAVSVTGTEAANGPHAQLGVPYWAVATAYLAALAGVLTWWQVSETTLSVRSIATRRREGFFWVAAMAAFALGTAIAHLTMVTTAGLAAWLAVTAVIVLTWLQFRSIATLAFWACFVITRPLGTQIGGLPASRYGVVQVSVVLGLVVASAVVYLATSGHDILETAASGSVPREDAGWPAPICQRTTSETPK